MVQTKQTQSRAPERPTPQNISVFNHSGHSIGIGIRTREAGTAGRGPDAYTIEFLPGNNSKTAEEMELCQATTRWSDNIKKSRHVGLLGKAFDGVLLEVGYHDKQFEVDSNELGERMHQIRQLAKAQAI